MNERIAVYAGTRNLYHDMAVSARSMLYHNGADRFVFMIEDDSFPEPIPHNVQTMNVSNQPYFRKDGPNYSSDWTYMVLMRAALTKYFPNQSRILSIDADTIVCGDISFLWTMSMDDAYLAAVPEICNSTGTVTSPYFNLGVTMMNLAKLRDGTDNKIIDAINNEWFQYNEQDAINKLCYGHIAPLPAKYNMCQFTSPSFQINCLIRHFAFEHPWQDKELYKRYERMAW